MRSKFIRTKDEQGNTVLINLDQVEHVSESKEIKGGSFLRFNKYYDDVTLSVDKIWEKILLSKYD